MENDIKALADAIYRDKVRRAREAPPTQKMGWGAELFHDACDRMRSGIRLQFGELPPDEVEALLRKRLLRLRRLHEFGIFQPAGAAHG